MEKQVKIIIGLIINRSITIEDEIKQYFDKVNEKFSLNDVEEIKKYIVKQIKGC